MHAASGRHVIGVVVADLVRFLINHERATGTTLPLSPEARELLSRRVRLAEWITLASFHELLRWLDQIAIQDDEARALTLGAQGGALMRGLQKAYGVSGDPKSSIVAMRHAWRAHYDFGRLTYDAERPGAVEFSIDEYTDMPMTHGLLTAGWGVAAARAGGATDVKVTVIERPWRGAPRFRYVIAF